AFAARRRAGGLYFRAQSGTGSRVVTHTAESSSSRKSRVERDYENGWGKVGWGTESQPAVSRKEPRHLHSFCKGLSRGNSVHDDKQKRKPQNFRQIPSKLRPPPSRRTP